MELTAKLVDMITDEERAQVAAFRRTLRGGSSPAPDIEKESVELIPAHHVGVKKEK